MMMMMNRFQASVSQFDRSRYGTVIGFRWIRYGTVRMVIRQKRLDGLVGWSDDSEDKTRESDRADSQIRYRAV